jgi:glycosyltransferase involved in cell wall biosynthesis
LSSTEPAQILETSTPAPAADPTDFPFISVIVPTYNRAAVLPFLFAALSRQLYPANRLELIVVDNSSWDDTEAVVQLWKRALPFEVSYYRKDNKGPATSRNYGAARARGEILAFTDSDCVPTSGWLRNAALSFGRGAGIVCGPFLPLPRMQDGLLASQQPPITYEKGCYPTANLLVRCAAFRAVGGFNEQFGLYPWGELIAGEDTDLAWRLRRLGERTTFRDDCTVVHLATPITLGRFLLRPIVVQIIPRLLTTIPELRRMYLWKRFFISAVHLYFLFALLGALLTVTTHRWWFALAVLPWLAHYARYAAACVRWEGARGIGRALLLVYNQVACSFILMLASIRYRRLVL